MNYGKSSKGNYPLLSKMAGKLPFFPAVQNQEYVRTSEMVQAIAEVRGKKIRMVKVFKPILRLMGKMGGKIGGLVNMAFGIRCMRKI